MAKKSIGSLYIDIEARTAKMEEDLEKVKKKLSGTAESTKNVGTQAGWVESAVLKMANKFDVATKGMSVGAVAAGVSVAAIGAALLIVAAKATEVALKLHDISGVKQETIQSFDNLKYSVHLINDAIEDVLVNGFSIFGLKIPGIVSVAGDAIDKLTYGILRLSNTEEEAQAKFEKFKDRAAVFANLDYLKSLSEIEERMNAITTTRGGEIDFMKEEADLLQQLANGQRDFSDEILDTHPRVQFLIDKFDALNDGQTSLKDRQELTIMSMNNELAAAEKLFKMRQQLYDLQEKTGMGAKTSFDENGNPVRKIETDPTIYRESTVQKLARAKAELDKASQQYQGALLAGYDGQSDGKALEAQIDALDKMAKAQEKVRGLQSQMVTGTMVMEDAMKSGFSNMTDYLTDFVKTGTFKLNNFLNDMATAIIQTFIKLAIVNTITNAIFPTAGLPTLFTPGVGGRASGGPINDTMWVGENGPEIWTPPTRGGTIIPNHEAMRSGRGTTTFNIDARGADGAGLARLESMMRSMNGSIEHRAVAAVASANRRGGGLARSLNTAGLY